MKVKELIEELKKFDEELKVVYNSNDGCLTLEVEKVYKGNEFYSESGQEVVIIF